MICYGEWQTNEEEIRNIVNINSEPTVVCERGRISSVEIGVNL